MNINLERPYHPIFSGLNPRMFRLWADYTSYDDNIPYYTMIIKEDGRKIKLLLDLTEDMLHTMKTQHPEKVYFA